MRVLGVDVGNSRTGVAISDALGVTCTPLPVIRERDRDQLLLKVVALAEEYGAGELVVGLPRPLAGGTNAQMDSVISFAERLKQTASMTIVMWDERFTSKLARSSQRASDEQDSVAACYILQDYLDRRSAAGGE